MLASAYANQCCLLICPEGIQPEKEFTDIHTVIAAPEIEKRVYTADSKTAAVWQKYNYPVQFEPDKDRGSLWTEAFHKAFDDGFRKVILLRKAPGGLQAEHLEEAFLSLRILEACFGPCKSGELYLAGMHLFIPELLKINNSETEPTWKDFQRQAGALKAALYKLPAF